MSSSATQATSAGQSGGPGDRASLEAGARVGQLLAGRYRILELLGEGGMGAVYLAEHTLMRKRVALKLLHAEMGKNAEILARFEREAVAAAHIEHPHVAAATDFGRSDDGAFFLVLEYIEGRNLRSALGEAPFAAERALRIVRQIALALERAHEAGIVHRDLKPENVMLVRRPEDPDFVKVLDFGIAKVSEEAIRDRGGDATGQPLTRLGTILGTPEYMAPEQALGEPVSAQSDLYALGVMLYEMLTGLHPFDPPDRMAMLSFHIVAPVPAMRDRAPATIVPPAAEAIALQLLQKDAKARFASARALIEAIEVLLPQLGGESGQTSLAGSRASLANAPSQNWRAADSFAKTSVGESDLSPAAPFVTGVGGAPGAGVVSARSLAEPPRPAGLAPPLGASLIETLKRQPRGVLMAIAAALPLGAVLMVCVAVVAFRPAKGDVAIDGGAAAAPVKKVDRSKLADDERLSAAASKGPDALEALAKDFPEDARVLQRTALAYHGLGRDGDALRIVTDAVSGMRVPEIVALVSEIASKPRGSEGADAAFALLEGPLGAEGIEALAEIASKGATKELRTRATRSLARPEVRSKATSATAVLLDFRAATSCSAKRDLMGRVQSEGDGRLLAPLKQLKSPRGCGFLGTRDCYPCLRKDDALDDAIAAVEARGTDTTKSTSGTK